jgi:hypothetical protein
MGHPFGAGSCHMEPAWFLSHRFDGYSGLWLCIMSRSPKDCERTALAKASLPKKWQLNSEFPERQSTGLRKAD